MSKNSIIKTCGLCKMEGTQDKFIKNHNRCKSCSLNMLKKYNYKNNDDFKEKIKKKQRLIHSKMSIVDKKKKSKRCALLTRRRNLKRKLNIILINKLMLIDIIKTAI
jgi:hypothetical protein